MKFSNLFLSSFFGAQDFCLPPVDLLGRKSIHLLVATKLFQPTGSNECRRRTFWLLCLCSTRCLPLLQENLCVGLKSLKRDWKQVPVESRECCFIFTRVARNLCCSNIGMAYFFQKWPIPSVLGRMKMMAQQSLHYSRWSPARVGLFHQLCGMNGTWLEHWRTGTQSVPKDDYSISLPICLSRYVMYLAI